jgi:hypothetical protein
MDKFQMEAIDSPAFSCAISAKLYSCGDSPKNQKCQARKVFEAYPEVKKQYGE